MTKKTEKKKHNRKITPGSILAFIIFAVLGAVCGVVIGELEGIFRSTILNELPIIIYFALMILLLYLLMFLQIIIHEAGHLVFGVLTGYSFVSFRILSFVWIKKDEHIEFKRYKLAGTGGQCLMAPPDLVNGRIPTLLYNLGGSAMNTIAALTGLAVYYEATGTLVGGIFLMFSIIGFGFALANGIPLKLGTVNNDGYNAMMLRNDLEAIKAFWIQLAISRLNAMEVRLKEMPDDWFEMPTDEQMENSLLATIAVFRANRMMDQHRFDEANELMKDLIYNRSEIMGLYKSLMICDRIYVEILEGNVETAQRLLTKSQLKFMKQMKSFPSVIRTEYALAKSLHNDASSVAKVAKRFEDVAKSHPYECEIESERELIGLLDRAR